MYYKNLLFIRYVNRFTVHSKTVFGRHSALARILKNLNTQRFFFVINLYFYIKKKNKIYK